jgi:hypothetical protein
MYPNKKISKILQKRTDLKIEINKSTMGAGDFKILLLEIDRTNNQRIRKGIGDLTLSINLTEITFIVHFT